MRNKSAAVADLFQRDVEVGSAAPALLDANNVRDSVLDTHNNYKKQNDCETTAGVFHVATLLMIIMTTDRARVDI